LEDLVGEVRKEIRGNTPQVPSGRRRSEGEEEGGGVMVWGRKTEDSKGKSS